MYEVYFSPSFLRKLKKLVKKNSQLKRKINKVIKTLASDPSNTSLKLHKLSGRNNWSISVTSDTRIIFSIRGDVVLCIDIGTHDEVY